LKLIGTVQPDVAIVDIMLENESGIELIKGNKALYPAVTVLVVHPAIIINGVLQRFGLLASRLLLFPQLRLRPAIE